MNILLLVLIFIKICSSILLFNYYNNINNKEKIKNMLINASYNSIYYFSKLQLEFTKRTNTIKDFVKSKPLLTNFINNVNNSINNNKQLHNTFEIIKGENICFYWNADELLNDAQKENITGTNYDFIIYSDKSKPCINNVIFNKFENIPEQKKIVYEEATYKFMMAEIIYDDKRVSVNLKSDTNNFLISGNKLDKNFIHYFFKKYHNINDLNMKNYVFKIIDHNVNIIEFDSTKSLVINKNDYILEDIDIDINK